MHDVLGLCGYSDYINVMTYDHHINDVETLHHTAPKNDGTGKYGDRGYSNEQTTQIFISNGVPAEKLILGCGLYTLEWSDACHLLAEAAHFAGVHAKCHRPECPG